MMILFGLIKVNMFTVDDSMPLNKRNLILIIIAPIMPIVIPLNPTIKKKLTLENS